MQIIFILYTIFFMANSIFALENSTCKKCHPTIYREYQNSIHANSSIYNDPIHKAVWDRHPLKKSQNYKCKSCHTPSDHLLMQNKTKLHKNNIQTTEPISCQMCHKIKSIQKGKKADKNILTKKEKYFFSKDLDRKGEKVIFHEEKSFFGLQTKTVGSAYHDIDYSNENFYNGKVCLGCHDHKANKENFLVCDIGYKKGDSKKNCITCHMPKIKGSFVELKDSKTHAFHGISIHKLDPNFLSKYIKLSLSKKEDGFTVTIKNEATHTLFMQPLRLSQLRVTIKHDGKKIYQKTTIFKRVIGKDGNPSPPWLATQTLYNNLIKAGEKRVIDFKQKLHKGDEVELRFGYYLVNPNMAKKLSLNEKKATEFQTLKQKRIIIK